MEKCFLCRGWVHETHIQRRVMAIRMTRGVNLGRYPSLASFVTHAPVSLCPRCDDEQTQREVPGPLRFLVRKIGWVYLCIVGGSLAVQAGHRGWWIPTALGATLCLLSLLRLAPRS